LLVANNKHQVACIKCEEVFMRDAVIPDELSEDAE
jgi:hypothetical protein